MGLHIRAAYFGRIFPDSANLLVVYKVDVNSTQQVCRGPPTGTLTWFNDSGAYYPTGIQPMQGWNCESDPSANPSYPHGLFCIPYVNPTGPGIAFRHFDNFPFGAL